MCRAIRSQAMMPENNALCLDVSADTLHESILID